MIRFVLLLSVVACPAVAQTAIADRPGRWVSVPRTEISPAAAPEAVAPETSGPLTAGALIITAPPATEGLATARSVPAPDTRPDLRPSGIAGEAPDIALDVFDVLEPAGPLAPIEGADAAAAEPDQRPQFRPSVTEVADLPAGPGDALVTAVPAAVWQGREPAEPPLALARVDRPEARMTSAPVALAAVTLPETDTPARLSVQPAAVARPIADPAPQPSRLRPSTPGVYQHVTAPEAGRPAIVSAVLLPSRRPAPVPIVRAAFMAMPPPDRYPFSVMAPELLPVAPLSLERADPPVAPRPEEMAGVLLSPVQPGVNRRSMPPPFEVPFREAAPEDPDAPMRLPLPDPAALARMVEDAAICWGFARLSPDAQWTRLSVDVALDETNMPAGSSIRLTGFSSALSSDAEDAFRAAHSALTGCAAATTSTPATRSATLVFDRNGIHLR